MDKIARIHQEIERRSHGEQGFNSEDAEYGYRSCARDLLAFIDSLQQEQPEVDLEKELDKFYGMYHKDGKTYDITSDEEVSDWKENGNFLFEIELAHHFYKLGRKQVLQEIYNGKTKPVDKITAAWLDD